MEETFLLLAEEKRKRILNAAMKEFAAKGYSHASTNCIVLDAGISKGSLFHYFLSKQNLFTSLFENCIEIFKEKMMNPLDSFPQDIIERWKMVSIKKIEIMLEYPLIFDFCMQMLGDETPWIQELVKNAQAEFSKEFEKKLYANIDDSKFRKDLEKEHMLQVIWWGLEGYARQLQARMLQEGYPPKEIMAEAVDGSIRYLELFRKVFYC